jgi:hypothetical protein
MVAHSFTLKPIYHKLTGKVKTNIKKISLFFQTAVFKGSGILDWLDVGEYCNL